MKRGICFCLSAILVWAIFFLRTAQTQTQISLKLFAEPNSYVGPCPATITFKGRVIVNEPCRLKYRFLRSDGAGTPINELIFNNAGWKDVSMSWTIGTDYSGWVSLKIVYPQELESEKAYFKITCKEKERPVVQAIPRPQEKETHPKVTAIRKASYQDQNEPNIEDRRDFKQVNIYCQKEKDLFSIEISTFETFSIGGFFLYFNTDDDEAAEIAARCSPSSFEVAMETAPGLYNNVIYQGQPSISGNTYSMEIPWSLTFGSQNMVIFWFYSMESQDRIPDSGMLVFDRSACEIKAYRLHPSSSAIPAIDNDKDGITDSEEEELLRRFRPYYRFSKKGGKSENYPPADAIEQIRFAQLKNDDWPPGREPDTVKSCGDPRDSYHINPPSRLLECLDGKLNIINNPVKTSYYLNLSDSKRSGSYDRSREAPGLYDHVVKFGNLYKIEYWQFFAYNGQDVSGDHEGDWCTVQVYYDPLAKKLVKTEHWAHGKCMAFDLSQTKNIFDLGDNFVEYRGPNYDPDPGSLHWEYSEAREEPRYPPAFQNNTVRFYKENNDLHIVVYLERDSHEFWPTEHGSWPGANEHNGKGSSYLVAYVPGKINLGEISNPLSDDAKIILRYNGYWGCYHHETNSPPPGPCLHCQWAFPDNERDLEARLRQHCEH